MFRRTKESVEFELGEKSRETILLDSGKVWNTNDECLRDTIENCKEYTADVEKLKGNDRKEVLLRLYAESAKLKANAVWFVFRKKQNIKQIMINVFSRYFSSYVKDLVKQKIKFIVFGYHKVMLDALSNCLNRLNTSFIRIDGSTRNDLRNTYIDRFQKDKSCQVAVLSLKGIA